MKTKKTLTHIQVLNLSFEEKVRYFYLHGEESGVEFSKKDIDLLEKVEYTYNHLRQFKTQKALVEQLQKKYKCQPGTATKLIVLARDIFGDINEGKKSGWRHIVSEMALDLYNKAKSQGDNKTMSEQIKNLIKIHNLDKEDIEDTNSELPEYKIEYVIDIEFLEHYGHEIDPAVYHQIESKLSKPLMAKLNDRVEDE